MKLYLVQWYEDAGLHLRHQQVFRSRAEAEACQTYLQSCPVFELTLKVERR